MDTRLERKRIVSSRRVIIPIPRMLGIGPVPPVYLERIYQKTLLIAEKETGVVRPFHVNEAIPKLMYVWVREVRYKACYPRAGFHSRYVALNPDIEYCCVSPLQGLQIHKYDLPGVATLWWPNPYYWIECNICCGRVFYGQKGEIVFDAREVHPCPRFEHQ